MNTALLIGCGSKFGLSLQQNLLSNGWAVNSISGTPSTETHDLLNHLVIDWKKFTVADLEKFLKNQSNIDLVFFNQNSSALSSNTFKINNYLTLELWKQEKTWAQCYFTSCILPFHIIHSLQHRCTSETKVAWMLSSFVHSHSDINHADYIGNKYQNYLIMRNFSLNHTGCFFGINPESLDNINLKDGIDKLTATINQPSQTLNGRVVFFDGTIDKKFNLFESNTKDVPC